jgi:hypothetical protein
VSTTGRGTWVPPEQQDTRWCIWNLKFRCRVPFIQTMSVDYMQHFGMPTVGDSRYAHYDKEMANEPITTMLSINQMVEYFRKGVTVAVCRHADTKVIYEHISNHLRAWKDKLEVGFNIRSAPIEDLILLDKFANAVYRHAAPYFTAAYVDSILARKMSESLRVTRQNVLSRPPAVKKINADPEKSEHEDEKDDGLPKRESMAETFARHQHIGTGGPKWGVNPKPWKP